jgi:alcohol dehydrogenase YqhD (iron-dependent ADH family)
MSNRTKLLTMVTEALQTAPPNDEAEAQAAIDAVADWFEEVLETIGITPSAIPSLLQWQAHQHEYLGEGADND